MTRPEALSELRRLSHGLAPDLAGTTRLLEPISTHPEAEALRDYLTEMGARALLDETSEVHVGISGVDCESLRSPQPRAAVASPASSSRASCG